MAPGFFVHVFFTTVDISFRRICFEEDTRVAFTGIIFDPDAGSPAKTPIARDFERRGKNPSL
jgi:hypothetical protein